jgi:hypothetical protein
MKNNIHLTLIIFGIACYLPVINGCASYHWQDAVSKNTVNSYEVFLIRYPETSHTTEALARIEQLDWDAARGENSIFSYEKFIQKHQQSAHIVVARTAIEEIKKEIDESDWKKAQFANTLNAFKTYLSLHPAGLHSSDALAETKKFPDITVSLKFPNGSWSFSSGNISGKIFLFEVVLVEHNGIAAHFVTKKMKIFPNSMTSTYYHDGSDEILHSSPNKAYAEKIVLKVPPKGKASYVFWFAGDKFKNGKLELTLFGLDEFNHNITLNVVQPLSGWW